MSLIREHIVKRFKRSGSWAKTRKEHIKKQPFCICCGRTKSLEVHHIEDFSEHPEKELDQNNLATLCDTAMRCHRLIGHLGDWKSINPAVIEDSIRYLKKRSRRRGVKGDEQELLRQFIATMEKLTRTGTV